MFFNMVFGIEIGKYRLTLLDSVEIHKSVDLLADTAVIRLPGAAYNQALKVEKQVKYGDRVTVRLGYDFLQEKPEFEGYVRLISTDGDSIEIECEDDIFLTRKEVENKIFAPAGIKQIAEYVAKSSGLGGVDCDYDFRYDKFTIYNATGFDVLKKLQDEARANIYIRDNVLHIHPVYSEKTGDVKYDFARNIEKADLTYRRAEDRKIEVEVEGIGIDGKRVSTRVGTMGGDRRSVKLYGVYSVEELKKRGEEELKYLVYEGYEGSITGWLEPYTEPGFSAQIRDADYDYKDGVYYVISVTTSFNDGGASRRVELGRKLGKVNS